MRQLKVPWEKLTQDKGQEVERPLTVVGRPLIVANWPLRGHR